MNAPINILLVDDEPRNLDVLENVLQSPDLRLVRAESAEAALYSLLHDDFAVMVLDIQMPGMSGLELASLVKQREKTQHIPIIFLTAFYQDERRMLESYNVGAVDYLTKPVNPQILRSKVGVFVDLFRKNAALRASNAALEQEIAQRKEIERALHDSRDELEARVEARTAALRQARDDAERAGRAKDDFLAALSHELRTPLNPVLLLASDAADNPAYSTEVRGHFATIRNNVELEARLIDDLLDLTRITRGKLTLDLQPRDVHPIIREAVATVRADLSSKNIALTLDLAATLSDIMADNVRLQQVFWNLLKNAVKFTPPGGTVTVSTRNVGDPPSAVRVAVRDSGIGLSPVELARVFNAFSQGDHARTGGSHRFGGLGLGLTISRSLVENHHGRLNATSPGQGHGSTFTVDLPLLTTEAREQFLVTESAKAATQQAQPDRRPRPRLRHVLLVEDHEPTRKTLELLLKRRGFEVTPSASLAEARSATNQRSFDLLISDIGLPDGTGYELMRELNGNGGGICGIALTGYGMEQDVDQSREAGFEVHLTKPINIQALDKALSALAG